MKIAVMSDLHLNKTVYKGVYDDEFAGLPFRNADFMRAFRWMKEKCLKDIHPDMVVIPGDVYDYYEPSNDVRGFFSAQLKGFAEAKIPVIILLGNHDVCRKHHALKDIQELGLKNIRIIEKPQGIIFKNHHLLLFPYSMDVEKKLVTMKEEFENFIEHRPVDEDKTTIFFGHFGVRGGKINEYSDTEASAETFIDAVTNTTTTLANETNETTVAPKKVKRDFINRDPKAIGTEDLDRIGADYVILGDYHFHHILPTKKCKAMYVGSVERTDFSEKDQPKGFIVYDSEAEDVPQYGKCHWVEYPHPRAMIELKGTLEEMQAQFIKLSYDKLKGAIVKLTFIGTSEELLPFSRGLESLKKSIKEKVEPIHVFHKQTVKFAKEEEEEASRIIQSIMEKGHMDDEDVINVVKEIVAEKIVDEKEQKLINDMAEEIYQATMENK